MTDHYDPAEIEAVKKRMALLRSKIEAGDGNEEQLYALLGVALKDALFLGLRKHDLFPDFYPRDEPDGGK